MNISFEEFISRQGIVPQKISPYELAWKIDDTKAVLQWLSENNKVVLGGDILDINKEYTYDNWYYNPDDTCSSLINAKNSIEKASEYISNYIDINGSDYYVVLISKQRFKRRGRND